LKTWIAWLMREVCPISECVKDHCRFCYNSVAAASLAAFWCEISRIADGFRRNATDQCLEDGSTWQIANPLKSESGHRNASVFAIDRIARRHGLW
jgi:hypothetical protein